MKKWSTEVENMQCSLRRKVMSTAFDEFSFHKENINSFKSSI